MEDNQQVVTQAPSMSEYSTVIDAPSAYNMTDSEKGVENLDPPISLAESNPSVQNCNPGDENAYAHATHYSAVHVGNGNVSNDSMAAVATDNPVGHEVDEAISTHAVNYDSVNGVPSEIVYQSPGAIEYGGASEVPDAHTVAQHFEEGNGAFILIVTIF